VSGTKSDAADAYVLAELVRLDRAEHRMVAGDGTVAEGVKLAARADQGLVGERTRHVLWLRSALRESYPVALQTFPELDASDALELLAKGPDPDRAAALTRRTLVAVFTSANRRDPQSVTPGAQPSSHGSRSGHHRAGRCRRCRPWWGRSPFRGSR
jgi:hypothetical protein